MSCSKTTMKTCLKIKYSPGKETYISRHDEIIASSTSWWKFPEQKQNKTNKERRIVWLLRETWNSHSLFHLVSFYQIVSILNQKNKEETRTQVGKLSPVNIRYNELNFFIFKSDKTQICSVIIIDQIWNNWNIYRRPTSGSDFYLNAIQMWFFEFWITWSECNTW